MVFNVLEDSYNVTMAVDLVIAGRQSVMFYDSTFCSFKQKLWGEMLAMYLGHYISLFGSCSGKKTKL